MELEINSEEFSYTLPEDRIALYPLKNRDQSKLLMYKAGQITHHRFDSLPQRIPSDSTLFFNDTRVIPARLFFTKETGAQIEVFLLNPIDNTLPVQLAMQAIGKARWKCTIGNQKKWKQETTLRQTKKGVELCATLKNSPESEVEFEWSPAALTFAEVVQTFGNTPLPPYLHRDAEEEDKNRYQTVYSHHEGAVAAPTAGLHFSESVISQLKERGALLDYLTLHVSAGTFQPIKTKNAFEHPMHCEQIIVTRQNLETLLLADRKVIAVGTTSMRTLESLYWYGVKLLNDSNSPFIIGQNDPYGDTLKLPEPQEAFQAVKARIGNGDLLVGHTSIFMVPGYKFRVCSGLVTNFHQPGSTLMLLVAAFIGKDWKTVYEEALKGGYRFLSYGDSSLLFRE